MNRPESTIRPMNREDLEQVIVLDAEPGVLRRDDFFRRRWRAMENSPQSYIGLVAAGRNTVEGFVLAHILTGEFGAVRPLTIIDAIAVDPWLRSGGVGAALMEALKAEAATRQCTEIRTLADWDRQDLLEFFRISGFSPAPFNVLRKSLPEDNKAT